MAEIILGIHLVDGTMESNVYAIVDDGITLVDTGMKGDEFIKPLNYDMEKARSLASIMKMGSLDYEIILLGHSKPIMAGASKKVADYAEKLEKEEVG